MSEKKLNPKQELFVIEYLKDLNATAAAIRAGYASKNADVTGSRLLAHPGIKPKIDQANLERQERTKVSADEVIRRLDNFSNFDPAEAFNPEGRLKNIHDIPANVRKCIKSIKVFEEFDGVGRDRKLIGETVEVTWIDRTKPTENLGRHHKLFTDRIEDVGAQSLADRLARARARVKGRK